MVVRRDSNGGLNCDYHGNWIVALALEGLRSHESSD